MNDNHKCEHMPDNEAVEIRRSTVTPRVIFLEMGYGEHLIAIRFCPFCGLCLDVPINDSAKDTLAKTLNTCHTVPGALNPFVEGQRKRKRDG